MRDRDNLNAAVIDVKDDCEGKPSQQIPAAAVNKRRIPIWRLDNAVHGVSDFDFEGNGGSNAPLAIPSRGRDCLFQGVGMKAD